MDVESPRSRRPRVTIAYIMALVALAAPIFALASRSSDPVGEVAIIATTLAVFGLLALAIVGAIYRRGERGAFWLGFALFGWISLGWVAGIVIRYGPPVESMFLLVLIPPPFAWMGGLIARRFAVE